MFATQATGNLPAILAEGRLRMCYGYYWGSSRETWEEALEQRRVELRECIRQSEREHRETVRAAQEAELRRLEKVLTEVRTDDEVVVKR
jgi:hypothetical protein